MRRVTSNRESADAHARRRAAALIATPAPLFAATISSLIGTVTIPGTIDRPKAEAIGMAYAQKHWPKRKPSFAMAFIMPDGDFKVVIAFDKSRAGTSICVRNTDGEVMDASIAKNHCHENYPAAGSWTAGPSSGRYVYVYVYVSGSVSHRSK